MNTPISQNSVEPKVNGYTYQLFILQGVLLALLSFPGMVNVITMTQPVKGFTELWAALLWCAFLLIRLQPESERQNRSRPQFHSWRLKAGCFVLLIGMFAFAMSGGAKQYLGALLASLLTVRLYTQDQKSINKLAALMAAVISLVSFVMGWLGQTHLLLEFTYLALSIPYFTIAASLAWRAESLSPLSDRAAS